MKLETSSLFVDSLLASSYYLLVEDDKFMYLCCFIE